MFEHNRYWHLFGDPSLLVCGLLLLQVTLITFQVLVIAKSQFWYHLLSQVIDIDNIDILFTNISLYHRLYFQGILAFGNYYTLFKLTRDYLILSKIYKAEKLLIERFSSSFQS